MTRETPPHHVLLVHPGAPSWRQRSVQHRLARRLDDLDADAKRGALTVVLHNPWGEGSSIRVPEGTHVFSTLELLGPERQRELDDWALGFSGDLSDDTRGVFPVRSGIGFGFLNRLDLINGLHTFRTLEEAIRSISERVPVKRLEILTPDGELSRHVAESVRNLVHDVDPWGPLEPAPLKAVKGFVRRVQARARGILSHPTWNRDLANEHIVDTECKTLIVSWTDPMTGMFEPLERAIGPEARPWIRLQFGSDRAPAVERREGGEIWHLGPPGAGPPPESPSFAEEASSVNADSRWSNANFPRWGSRSTEALLTVLEVEGLYRNSFDRQANHIDDTISFLDRLNPDVIVVGNDRWWVGQTFVGIAEQRGIPSVCLQDGAAQDSPLFRWMSASAIALTSNHLGDLLRAEGISEDRLFVTGQPRYDTLVHERGPKPVAEARARLDLEEGPFYVLFATQYTQGLDYIQAVTDAILNRPNVHLLLRPHPSGPAGYHRSVAEQYGPERLSVRKNDSIADLLKACDLLVAQSSTVILEAAILGKPVISAQFEGMVTLAHVAASGAVVVPDPQELAAEVQRMGERWQLGERSVDRFDGLATDYVGPVDGSSGERVATLLARLARGEAVPNDSPY